MIGEPLEDESVEWRGCSGVLTTKHPKSQDGVPVLLFEGEAYLATEWIADKRLERGPIQAHDFVIYAACSGKPGFITLAIRKYHGANGKILPWE